MNCDHTPRGISLEYGSNTYPEYDEIFITQKCSDCKATRCVRGLTDMDSVTIEDVLEESEYWDSDAAWEDAEPEYIPEWMESMARRHVLAKRARKARDRQ